MATASLEEIRGQISAGRYAPDSGQIAAAMVDKFALARKVTRLLVSEGEGSTPGEADPTGRRRRRRTRSAPPNVPGPLPEPNS